MFGGRSVLRQNEKLCVYNMTSMTKLDLGKKAAFKSSFANLVKQTMGGIQNTFCIFGNY